jgi:putative spermidine/putrescine transport system substrate-binding protein
MADLVAAAQKEGTVNLIATPPEWANYDGIIKGFVAKYNIKAPVANPEGSSADEITAITSLKGQASQPDAVDVGNTFARDNVALFTKYKVAGWDEVPANMKDPDGAWVGGYYGVIAIGANEKVTGPAPTTLKALDDPKYKNMFGLNGDPRKSSSGLNGVWAAALANGGSFDDIGPGIEFFAKLKKDGILVPVDVTPAVLASGQVSIAMDWSYNFPGVADTLAKSGITMKVNIPTDGVFGNFYAQAVVAGAPHPNAGKLWLEWLLGDEGALGYLKGGAFPARFVALQKAGKIPADLAAKLPSADVMAKVSFPTADQSKAAKDAIAKDWGPKVAGN